MENVGFKHFISVINHNGVHCIRDNCVKTRMSGDRPYVPRPRHKLLPVFQVLDICRQNNNVIPYRNTRDPYNNAVYRKLPVTTLM